MTTAAEFWRSVGETFVDRTPELSLALAEQAATGRPLIDILVSRGLVSAHDLNAALFTFDQEEEAALSPRLDAPPANQTLVPLDEARRAHALRLGPANSRQLDHAQAEDRHPTPPGGPGATRERYGRLLRELNPLPAQLDGLFDRIGAATNRLQETRARLVAGDQRQQEKLARWQAVRPETAQQDGELATLHAQLEEKKQEWAEAREVARSELGRAAKLEAEAALLVSDVAQSARALADLIASHPHPERPYGARPGRHAEPDPRSHANPTSDDRVLYLVPQLGTSALIERDGPVPTLGDVLEFDGRRFVVTRVARSPLLFDQRPCVFLANR